MSEKRFHYGTFLWGALLAVAGVGLLGVDLGWWELRLVDLRFVGPIVLMLIGAIVVIGSLSRREH